MNDDDVVARIMAVVNRYDQKTTITDISGSCLYGHCKGDSFKVTSMNIDGLCGGMYQAVHSQIVTCHHGGEIQWEKEPGSHSGICPEGVVHLDVKRKEKECRSFSFGTEPKTVEMTDKGFSVLTNTGYALK